MSEGCGGNGGCAIGIADKLCPNCPVPNEAPVLGWDQRGYEWIDAQGMHWKWMDGRWWWYWDKSHCWHRNGDRRLIAEVGPFTRRTT